jgi:hypothetical protein
MGNTGSQTLPSWPTGRQLGRSMSMAIPMPPQQHMVSKCRRYSVNRSSTTPDVRIAGFSE